MKRLPNSPLAWAQACKIRKIIDRMIAADWPSDSLTRKETKSLQRAIHSLWDAQEEIRSVQGSMSKRCKDGGVESPDYQRLNRLIEDGKITL